MNQNPRLNEILSLKKDYALGVLSAESEQEVEEYYLKIDELKKEEIKIQEDVIKYD